MGLTAMKEILTFTNSFTMGTFTVRACGWKASSTVSVFEAAKRLIEKMYDYTPTDLEVVFVENANVFQAAWTEAKKEAA